MRNKYIQVIRMRNALNESYRKYRNDGRGDAAQRQKMLDQSRALDGWIFDAMKRVQNTQKA